MGEDSFGDVSTYLEAVDIESCDELYVADVVSTEVNMHETGYYAFFLMSIVGLVISENIIQFSFFRSLGFLSIAVFLLIHGKKVINNKTHIKSSLGENHSE